MFMKSDLVVALYRENHDWIYDALDTGKVDRVFVYNKGPEEVRSRDDRVSVIPAENVGREGETFLSHIIQNWDCLSHGIWFAQGDPFEHSPDFIELLRRRDAYCNEPYWAMSDRFKVSHSIPPKEMVEATDAYRVEGLRCSNYFVRGMQVVGHCGFMDYGTHVIIKGFKDRYRVADSFEYLSMRLRIARPRPITDFAYGACFYTLGSCIRRHPRWTYEEARRFLLETDDQGAEQGYILERYWPYLVCGRSYESLADCYRSLIGDRNVGIWNRRGARFWFKSPKWDDVIYNPDSFICFFDGSRVRHLAGLDLVGDDLWDCESQSLQQADEILARASGQPLRSFLPGSLGTLGSGQGKCVS